MTDEFRWIKGLSCVEVSLIALAKKKYNIDHRRMFSQCLIFDYAQERNEIDKKIKQRDLFELEALKEMCGFRLNKISNDLITREILDDLLDDYGSCLVDINSVYCPWNPRYQRPAKVDLRHSLLLVGKSKTNYICDDYYYKKIRKNVCKQLFIESLKRVYVLEQTGIVCSSGSDYELGNINTEGAFCFVDDLLKSVDNYEPLGSFEKWEHSAVRWNIILVHSRFLKHLHFLEMFEEQKNLSLLDFKNAIYHTAMKLKYLWLLIDKYVMQHKIGESKQRNTIKEKMLYIAENMKIVDDFNKKFVNQFIHASV